MPLARWRFQHVRLCKTSGWSSARKHFAVANMHSAHSLSSSEIGSTSSYQIPMRKSEQACSAISEHSKVCRCLGENSCNIKILRVLAYLKRINPENKKGYINARIPLAPLCSVSPNFHARVTLSCQVESGYGLSLRTLSHTL